MSTAAVSKLIKNSDLEAIRLLRVTFGLALLTSRTFKRHEIRIREELELTDLEIRLIEVVGHNPRGLTLVQLSKTLRIDPVVVGRVARSILDMGKIRKEDNRYYPANSITE